MRFTCSCGKQLQVNDALAGKLVKCPGCGQNVVAREDGIRPTPATTGSRPRLPQDDDSPPPRPRRRDDADEDAPAVTKGASVLGIISLVLGILGLLISLIPCVGMFIGGPIAGIGLLLGVIGLIVALKTKQSGPGMPIAGSVVSFLGLCVAGGWLAISTLWVHQAKTEVQAQVEKLEKEAQAQAEKAKQDTQAIRQGPAIEVTAAVLHKEYSDNAFAADRKYKGKVLEVKGQVVKLIQAGDDATVELKTDEEGETVDREFDEGQKNDLAELKPGQQVTIRGRCNGQDGGSPGLETCILVKKAVR